MRRFYTNRKPGRLERGKCTFRSIFAVIFPYLEHWSSPLQDTGFGQKGLTHVATFLSPLSVQKSECECQPTVYCNGGILEHKRTTMTSNQSCVYGDRSVSI